MTRTTSSARYLVEKHYRVKELAALWGCCGRTISARFMNEPGVLNLGSRRWALLCIPESVASRVHQTYSGAWPVLETCRGRKTLKLG